MDRFLTGSTKPPPAKKTKTTDSAEYEKKREHTFQTSWSTTYSWLVYLEHDKSMTCSICSSYERTGSFVTGCTNLRLEAIKKHEKSQGHQDNLQKEKAKNDKKLSDSQAGRSLLQMNKFVFARICNLFRNAHMVAKLGRPYTDFTILCQLDNMKKLDIGSTYHTDKSCQKFIAAIADNIRSQQDSIIEKAPFMALISDGSTDTSSQEAEILYARTSSCGKVSTHFIGVKNVPKADAATITNALVSLLDGRFGNWRKKVTAMGTDGASVMLGHTSGVVKRLQDYTDGTIYAVHCSAHRLELAYKDATKTCTMVKKLELLLLNLYMFYKYSSLNRANLKSSFKSLGQEVVIPTRVGGTRWLPHTKKAIEHVIKGYDAIVQHLEQMQGPDTSQKDSSAKARNFLKILKDKAAVGWFHMMLDIIVCLSDVSETIQTRDSTVSDVWLELQSAKTILTSYIERDGPYLNKCQESSKVPIGPARTKFLTTLVSAVDKRFEGGMELFKGSSILSFKQWPVTDEGYGDENVQTLTDLTASALTNQGANTDKVMAEWVKLKTRLYDSGESLRPITWEEVFRRYEGDFPNLQCLIDLLLTIPSSSVDAERGFSRMKLVKNDWRSRLGEKNLSDLMLLYMESPPVPEFSPDEAVQRWFVSGKRSRRPNYMEEIMSCSEPLVVGSAEDDVVEDDGGEEEVMIQSDYWDEKEDLEDMHLSLQDVMALQKKKYEMLLSFDD